MKSKVIKILKVDKVKVVKKSPFSKWLKVKEFSQKSPFSKWLNLKVKSKVMSFLLLQSQKSAYFARNNKD
jgi:hypothetical protein